VVSSNLASAFVNCKRVVLVDRLATEGLVVREASAVDRRKVELHLSPAGRRVLARLAAMHREELRRIGPLMKRFFSALSRAPAQIRG
jgi:DNA-binding MarR family transcriptional regulator